jgi:hypothetical protein
MSLNKPRFTAFSPTGHWQAHLPRPITATSNPRNTSGYHVETLFQLLSYWLNLIQTCPSIFRILLVGGSRSTLLVRIDGRLCCKCGNHTRAFFFCGPSSSSSLSSAYMVFGCVFFQAFVNMGSFSAFSAYLSNASRGSSSRIELRGIFFLTCASSGWLFANGVVCGICGRLGSRDLPDAVSPIVG